MSGETSKKRNRAHSANIGVLIVYAVEELSSDGWMFLRLMTFKRVAHILTIIFQYLLPITPFG